MINVKILKAEKLRLTRHFKRQKDGSDKISMGNPLIAVEDQDFAGETTQNSE